jgi:regulator of replication initiation timing
VYVPQAENARLKAENDKLRQDALQAEVERLRAENERLRQASVKPEDPTPRSAKRVKKEKDSGSGESGKIIEID